MVVRDREGRQRYIAFVVTPPVPKARLTTALRDAGDRVRLVEYDGARGLVQCAHTAKDATIALLNGLPLGDATVRTLGTSGTIRKARAKFLRSRVSVE
ncbi:MAG: hypothetical protein HY557_05945 [Euryarchaeota archaeon]|nr:hypothetical protein [Euryarchaeota archaeon]